jgi:hypothetical protein
MIPDFEEVSVALDAWLDAVTNLRVAACDDDSTYLRLMLLECERLQSQFMALRDQCPLYSKRLS